MGSIASLLTRTSSLWFLFVATIAISASFPLVTGFWGLTLLDGISSPVDARLLVQEMTPHQRVVHAWITATLDVAYPLAYGGLFAGSALRVFGQYGRYAAIPALIAIPIDLLEGVVQVLALTNIVDWLDVKAIVTPLKMLMFISAMCIAIVAWITWLYRRIVAGSKTS